MIHYSSDRPYCADERDVPMPVQCELKPLSLEFANQLARVEAHAYTFFLCRNRCSHWHDVMVEHNKLINQFISKQTSVILLE